jgi:hypothetical protein
MSYATTHDAALSPRSRYIKAKHAAINSLNAVKLLHANRAQHGVEYRVHPDGLLIGSDGSVTNSFSGCRLTPRINRNGVAEMSASMGGAKRSFRVARLVVEAFHGPLSGKRGAFTIEHIDGDALNCAVENLRLVVFE